MLCSDGMTGIKTDDSFFNGNAIRCYTISVICDTMTMSDISCLDVFGQKKGGFDGKV